MMKNNLFRAVFLGILLMSSGQLIAASNPLIPDTVITAKIKAKLLSDYSHIKVSTNDNGIVTLSGTVNSNTDANTVIEKVESVDGVRMIDIADFYTKGSTHMFADAFITAKVKGLLIRKNLLDEKDINPWISVETTNSTVYLSGTAKSQKQIDTIVDLVKTIDGVKAVNTAQLKI